MDMWPEVFGADSRIPAICGKEKSWGKAEITMEQKKNRLHYAWFILAGCCILQGATLGLINNCAGVFYSPICKELGFELGKLTMYRMLYCISSALALPFVATSFRKHDVRIVISIAAVIYGGCAALMGTFHELWQWHLTGIIQGIASSFVCMIPAPIILGNWFKKKTGMAVGISAAFSGLVGMIGSSFLGMAIPAFGWRVSYVAVGIVSTALVLPISLFVLRCKPEEMGLLPYGAEDVEQRAVSDASAPASVENGTPIKELLRQPEFYIAVGAYWTSVSCAYLNSFLTPCGIAAGLTLQAAAMMTSISLLGNMSSKPILGKVSDSLGIIKTFEFSIALAFFGHVLLFLGSPKTVMAGSLFFGVTLPLSSVMMPLFCRIFWKGETYSTAYAYSTMVGTLLGAPFNMWFGTFYDITGDYRLTIGVSAVMLVMLTFLIMLEGTRLKRMKSETSPSQAR